MQQSKISIIVERFDISENYTLSKFFIYDEFFGYGIENPVRKEKIYGKTAIPFGCYPIRLTHSPKFSHEYYRDNNGNLINAKNRISVLDKKRYNAIHECILIDNVPNFSRVLIHWGNTPADTAGCYLVGSNFSINSKNKTAAITGSRKKYMQIYPKIFHALKNNQNVEICFKKP